MVKTQSSKADQNRKTIEYLIQVCQLGIKACEVNDKWLISRQIHLLTDCENELKVLVEGKPEIEVSVSANHKSPREILAEIEINLQKAVAAEKIKRSDISAHYLARVVQSILSLKDGHSGFNEYIH